MHPPTGTPRLLAARWQVGQSWRVEYLRAVPSTLKQPDPPRPAPQRSVWKYQVMGADAGRGMRIAAAEETGEGLLELWFSLPQVTLARVVKIRGEQRIDLIVHAGADPYFGWSPVYPVIFEWPRIPGAEEDTTREFTNDDGLEVEEADRFSAKGQFDITMTAKRAAGPGYLETRTCAQIWVLDSPWWSSASITTEYEIDGDKSREENIRGRLLSY